MTVAQELPDCVAAFVEGRITLPDLQVWLSERVQAIADANDPRTTELSDEVWILVAEWLDCLRDESSVRAELTEFLAQRGSRSTQPALTPNR
jgi:hypothetical protein